MPARLRWVRWRWYRTVRRFHSRALLFFNTLFDENAACHIALGRGLRFCLQNGSTLSEDEFSARGVNTSLIHVDFMIGSDQLNIDAITADGRREPVLRGGEWAFSL